MKSKKSKTQETPRKSGFPIIEGIEATAARIGASLAMLKAVKKKGSRAFLAGNRVDVGILLPDLFAAMEQASELPEGVTSPQNWLATEKAKREAIKRKVEEKSVIPADVAVRQSGQAMGYTFAELERRDRELPPVLAGLSAVEIFKKMSADTEAIRKTLKTKFQEIGQ